MLILLKKTKTKRIRKSKHKNTENDRWGRMIREEKKWWIFIKSKGRGRTPRRKVRNKKKKKKDNGFFYFILF